MVMMNLIPARLSDLLRENNLVPIVMRAQPGMSRVLTDKFEAEASKCSFAFAIFTPDDAVLVGSRQYGQARPNVIYETGWFIGRLGKERVVLLLKHGTEMHTDLQGVSRVQFVEDVSHAYGDIQRELRAAALIG
jgi:predicted nucleotide-binding protein